MPAEDRVMERFAAWDLRCRGHPLYPYPVALEPPFVPFPGYRFARSNRDDGRRETALSAFFSKAPKLVEPEPEPAPEPASVWRAPYDLAVLKMTASRSEPRTADLLRLCRQPTAFEILGTEQEVVVQWTTGSAHSARWKRAVESCADATVFPAAAPLTTAVVVELGLRTLVMAPLADESLDLAAVLDGLGKEEVGLFQVLFEPVEHDWGVEMERALTLESGAPLDADAVRLMKRKAEGGPLFAVVVRLAADATTLDRAWDIIKDMAGALSAMDGDNGFVPLRNDDYPPDDHAADVEARLSRRPGMLLTLRELCALVTPPWNSRCRKLRRDAGRAAPQFAEARGSVLLGVNHFSGSANGVWLPAEYRVRHTHIVGASGTGKSTLLFNMLRQDIERGEGIALLDPHGDLVERVLGIVPEDRRADVVLVDPSDEEHVVGFNILAAHSDFERNLLASDLVSTFRRLSTSWGEQMNSVLRNAVLAFLESSRGGTLADMRRFLLDVTFRKEFLRTVTDPDVVFYWERAFPQLTGNKSIGPVLTRLDEFLSRKPIRLMVSQHENRVDFSDILDHSRILLVKLPQGQIGRENANLLGSVIVSKIQQMAMSRQRMKENERRNFWVYLDEFHSFITPSMAEILTGARKYRVGLILAHQELHQLEADRDVASAVLANCCTRIVFRVSDRDARELASGLAHFEAAHLQNLGVGEAVCRVERSESDFNLTIPEPEPVQVSEADTAREETRRISNDRFARPRREVEAELLAKMRRQDEERPAVAARVRAADSENNAGTVSEKESLSTGGSAAEGTSPPEPASPVVSEAPSVSKPPPELGRGGMIHRDAQNRIKNVAEELGFRATLESQVGTGGADLALDRGNHRIGVEISITTGATHEVENVLKCLNGPFTHVAFITADMRRLEQVRERVTARLSADDAARVGFYQVETFVDYLRGLPKEVDMQSPAPPTQPSTTKVKGWTVKTKVIEQTSDEARSREEEAMKAIAQSLRKQPK